jgi:hypothetical protein
VPAETRQAAERALAAACSRLGIKKPRIAWWPAGEPGPRGLTEPDNLDRIFVRVQPPDAVTETACHEARHCYQLSDERWLIPGLDSDEGRERDADRYGKALAAELLHGGPRVPSDAHECDFCDRPLAWKDQRHDCPARDGGRPTAVAAQPAPAETGHEIWERKYRPMHEALSRHYTEQRMRTWRYPPGGGIR